ncbi:MAG: undecaprenyl-diphosphatase UppP [Anaerolineales bacterium]|jgi:undecaprenyl-diphosphatase
MTVIQAILLGIVQGATEFLPISSSGHLTLVPWVLNWRFEPSAKMAFDVLVHWGTLSALLLYFWRDLVAIVVAAADGLVHRRPFGDPAARMAWYLIAASVPAAALGLWLEDQIGKAFQNPMVVSGLLLITAAVLAVSERLAKRTRDVDAIRLPDALWIGLAQALALLPGISRSGVTIAAGMTRGLRREDAARFSFLLAIPVMVGAGVMSILDLAQRPDAASQILPMLAGFLSAGLVGYLAIRFLLAFLERRSLYPFAIYCTLAGLGGLMLSIFRG